MHSFEIFKHPKLQLLIKRFQNKFPKIDLFRNMEYLGDTGYTGMGMNVNDIKKILERCLKEGKYFKVHDINWKGDDPMPDDWWEGKVVYYNYKG